MSAEWLVAVVVYLGAMAATAAGVRRRLVVAPAALGTRKGKPPNVITAVGGFRRP